jgi:hypothetical protein
VLRWDHFDSSGIIGSDRTFCRNHSATENASGVVLWCVCEQCEVSKRDSSEVQECSRTKNVEEAVEERGEEESTQSLGRIAVAKLWCHGRGMYALWKDDAITGSCDLSTSNHEDFTWFRCESTWTWFYGTAMVFLWGIVPIRMSRLFEVFGNMKLF